MILHSMQVVDTKRKQAGHTVISKKKMFSMRHISWFLQMSFLIYWRVSKQNWGSMIFQNSLTLHAKSRFASKPSHIPQKLFTLEHGCWKRKGKFGADWWCTVPSKYRRDFSEIVFYSDSPLIFWGWAPFNRLSQWYELVMKGMSSEKFAERRAWFSNLFSKTWRSWSKSAPKYVGIHKKGWWQ